MPVTVRTDGVTCEGLLIHPPAPATQLPCVLIAPTIRGRSAFEEERAHDLAATAQQRAPSVGSGSVQLSEVAPHLRPLRR